MIHQFEAPLYLVTAKNKLKGKKYYINMNQYRNWRFAVSNAIKIEYKNIVSTQFTNLKLSCPIKLTFTLHRNDKRKGDRANVLSIHEKFFCDALVESGCLPDDNDEFIISTTYLTGDILPKKGRVIITIEEL